MDFKKYQSQNRWTLVTILCCSLRCIVTRCSHTLNWWQLVTLINFWEDSEDTVRSPSCRFHQTFWYDLCRPSVRRDFVQIDTNHFISFPLPSYFSFVADGQPKWCAPLPGACAVSLRPHSLHSLDTKLIWTFPKWLFVYSIKYFIHYYIIEMSKKLRLLRIGDTFFSVAVVLLKFCN